MKHGAKVKLCNSEGCTNQVQKGGVCCRHGANRNPYDESTAFGSEFDKITATYPICALLLELPSEDKKEVAFLEK